MGTQRTNFRSWDEEKAHREKRIKKLEKIQILQALSDEWDGVEIESEEDLEYVRDIRRRLRSAQNQYKAMKA